MNLMNRKLFKTRPARDKLNQMGGIMSSSQPLMQTVQKFKDGQSVRAPSILGGALPVRPATTYSGTSRDFRMLPRSIQQKVLDAENRQRGIAQGLGTALKFGTIPIELGYKAGTEAASGLYNLALSGLKQVGLADPSATSQAQIPNLGLPEMFNEMSEKGKPIKNVEELQGILEMQQGAMDPAIQRTIDKENKEKQQEAVSAQLAEDIIAPGYSMPDPDAPFMVPGVTPSPDKKEEAAAERLTDGAARDDFAAGPAAGDQALAEAKSGALGAEAQVKAVFNEGTPEEVDNQLKEMMAEFTSNAPEYEGLDKGMALAKIGFAMAAGQSPDAITNIATALQGGADMFIQDKNKRDAFNRQVQLSALQYGLTEQGKDRAARRQMQYKTTDYVLMPGESYTYPDGRTVTGGENGTTISLNQASILENGLPDGVQGTNMATAIIQRKADYEKAAAKAKADAIKGITVNDPKKITDFVTNYSDAANDAIQANNAMHLTKQVMVTNADGQITGFRPGFNSALAKAMALAGVDATEYTDRDLAIADLRKVFQKLVPLTLGEDQSANSISDKDVDRLANAYMSAGILDGGVMALMTTPANVLNSKLSGVLTEFERAEESALATLGSLEQTGQEFITPSGATLGSRVGAQRARVQEIFPQKGTRPTLAVRDDGTFYLPN